MNPTVLRSLPAKRDLVETADYLEQAAGLAVAERYLAAVELGLVQLARMPAIGSLCEYSNPRLQNIRS
jgi:plasmid stabilization system protein ParE